MQIQSINNTTFNAKIRPGTSGGATNKHLHELFEKKTSQYKDLTMLQDEVSFKLRDQFKLFNKAGERIAFTEAPHSCYSYSCLEEYVDEYVKIFNKLVEQAKDTGKL